MEYKEKWLTLKEDIENLVHCGYNALNKWGNENQIRLRAYKIILDYMCELDGDELKKTKQNSNKEIVDKTVDEKLEQIIDELMYELLVDLSKNRH